MASCGIGMVAVFAVVILTGAMLLLVAREPRPEPEPKKKRVEVKKTKTVVYHHKKHKQGPRSQPAQPSQIPEAYTRDEYAPL